MWADPRYIEARVEPHFSFLEDLYGCQRSVRADDRKHAGHAREDRPLFKIVLYANAKAAVRIDVDGHGGWEVYVGFVRNGQEPKRVCLIRIEVFAGFYSFDRPEILHSAPRNEEEALANRAAVLAEVGEELLTGRIDRQRYSALSAYVRAGNRMWEYFGGCGPLDDDVVRQKHQPL